MLRLLVVDDEFAVLRLAKRILERAGFEVLIARNGSEALTVLAHHDIDVLLTDWVMPGMNGGELILEARRRFPDLPVCCMTGHIPDPHPALTQVRVLEKPFVAERLVEFVRQTIDTQDQANRPLKDLREKVREAKVRWRVSKNELDAIGSEGPGAIPHPDGAFRREQAYQKCIAHYAAYQNEALRYRNELAKYWAAQKRSLESGRVDAEDQGPAKPSD